jgi:DUF1680 family protein
MALAVLAPGIAAVHGKAVLTPVPIRDVKIDDAFWTPKLDLWRQITLNDVFSKFEEHGAFTNFDRVAAQQSGGHAGEPWWDGLVYETITASADFMAAHPDPVLRKRIAGYVTRIAAAAAVDPDGYVNTGATLDHIGVRWSAPPAPGERHNDNFPHTIYNAGCLVEAGVHLYRATGDIQLLRVATRMANYMSGIMGPPPKQNIVPGHAVSEMAFVELYELYRSNPDLKQEIGLPVAEDDFLKLAEFWIENRGHKEGRDSEGAYNQDDVPVFEQPTLEGHAVRSALLATGVATAGAVNGRSDYASTAARWWENMAAAKMYLTGGLGSIPSIEGFGQDFELPNQGYTETCASAAAGFFSERMNLLTGDAKYIDVLERELYNGALSGISLEGTSYFYTNFLNAGPDHRRWSWMGGAVNVTPCCPPMFLKLQGALPGALYATGDKGIYVNLYAGSSAHVDLGETKVELQQKTSYPWDGDVSISVTPEEPTSFPLNLRVPGWAKRFSAEVNGAPVTAILNDHYLRIDREWQAGDHVILHLPMPVERMKADPRVKADIGRVALMRGPIVYCLEGIDNGGRVSSLQIPASTPILLEVRADLLGGVTVLRGTALRLRKGSAAIPQSDETPFVAIPFYANSNRSPTDMAVWVADEPSQVVPLPLAGDAIASASHCYGGDSVQATNDGIEPKSSDDGSIPRMTWWDHRGGQEWAQLTFPSPRSLSGAEVYWWDERRTGRDCRVPASWTLQYLDGSEWRPVTGVPEYGIRIDAFNAVNFQPVTTTALRVVANLQPGWSGGILEWKIRDSSPVNPSGKP